MKKFTSLCGLCAILALSNPPAHAQQRTEPPTGAKIPSTNNHRMGVEIRASKMIGMAIHNPEGKNVGKINDLVMDAATGKIRYAAVTYGGFLGIGDKLFAVPFEAFSFKPDRNDPKTRLLILDVSQKQLEGSQGFDENNWPDFADSNFLTDLDKRYNVKRMNNVP